MPLPRRRSSDVAPAAAATEGARDEPRVPRAVAAEVVGEPVDLAQLLIDGLRELMGVRLPEEDPAPAISPRTEISTTAAAQPKRRFSSSS